MGDSKIICVTMKLLDGFHFKSTLGCVFDAHSVQILDKIKGEPRMPKWVYLAKWRQRKLFLKIRSINGLKDTWQAVRGRSNLQCEARNITLVGAAGFTVPKLVAVGIHARFGLPSREVIVLDWVDDSVCLRRILEKAAAQHDKTASDAARRTAINLLARVRQAGFSDKDFGFHNILVQPAAVRDNRTTVWTDLERVYSARSGDPQGTYEAAGSLLSSWWLAAGPDQHGLSQTLDQIVTALPEPDDGWKASEGPLNRYIAGKLQWHLAHGRTPAVPEPLVVG